MKNLLKAMQKMFQAQSVYEFATQRNLFLPTNQAIYRLHGSCPTNGLEARSYQFPFTFQQLADYVAFNATHGCKPLVYGSCQSIEDLETGFLNDRKLETNDQHGLLVGMPKHKLYLPGALGIEIQMCADEDAQKALGDKISREKEVIFDEMTQQQALVYVKDLSALKGGDKVHNLLHEVNPKLPKLVTLDEINSQEYLQDLYQHILENKSVHSIFFNAGASTDNSNETSHDQAV